MTAIDTTYALKVSRRRNIELVGMAVHRHPLLSKAGINERAFTLAFSSLVYPQIWEDPRVDMEAMALAPGHRVVTIASGGCNLLSYLTAAPIEVIAVDLNSAHVALNRLKIAALKHLTNYSDFYRLFGNAASPKNASVFDTKVSPHLDSETRAYWTARDWRGRRRIALFSHGFYRYGLLGRFIAAGHLAARMLGGQPKALLKAQSMEEQREIFDRELKPLFSKPIVRKILESRSSLFGLGIPPAQYDALSEGRPMHEVVLERLERLACGYPIKDNYFAWQAFNRGYGTDHDDPLPPYLQEEHFETVRTRVSNVNVHNISLTTKLESLPARSIDRFVLLDAQDWMGDGDLNALWREIARTARPSARVIFRTAGTKTILPGRVRQSLLNQWVYRADDSLRLSERDRSAIYGGFHLYERV